MRPRLPGVLLLAATLLTACIWVSMSWGEQKIPRIGKFVLTSKDAEWSAEDPFDRALRSDGWVEGKSVAYVYANIRGDTSRYPEAVAELIRLKVDLIFADSAPAVRAAFAATRTIPM